jgi:hypothetical protein
MQDVTKAITTATAIYQPDLWIRTNTEGNYTGNDVYSTDGTGESKSQTVPVNTTATYLIFPWFDGHYAKGV